jgi:hypothetical protein
MAAIALPLLLLVRSGAAMAFHLYKTDPQIAMTEDQKNALQVIDCVAETIRPGEGFLSEKPEWNYLVSANLKARPFVPMGLSPVSLEEITERYLIASYLTASDRKFESPIAESDDPLVHARDEQLYLYINLFRHKDGKEQHQRVQNQLMSWDPMHYDWAAKMDALRSVSSIYVERSNLDLAQMRLSRFYEIERSVECSEGTALRVNLRASN